MIGVEIEGITLHIGVIAMNPCSLGVAETCTEVEVGIPGFNSGLKDVVELEDGVVDGSRLAENVEVVNSIGEQDTDVLGVNTFVIKENELTDGVVVPVPFLLPSDDGAGELLLNCQ